MQKAQLKMHWKVRERKKYYHWKKFFPQGLKKIQGFKERYYRYLGSRRQDRKRESQENPEQQKEYEKNKNQENPKWKKVISKNEYKENSEQEREFE